MMDSLPELVINKILTCLDIGNFLKLRLTCRKLNEIILDFCKDLIYFRVYIDKSLLEHSLDEVVLKLKTLNEVSCNSAIKQVQYSIQFDRAELEHQVLAQFLPSFSFIKLVECEIHSDLFNYILYRTEVKSLILNKVTLIDIPRVMRVVPLIHWLTELRIGECFHLFDCHLWSIADALVNLEHLEVVNTKMVFFPHYTRRYYKDPDNLERCWSMPCSFGLTFAFIRALLTFRATRVTHLTIGPNLSEVTPSQVLQIDSLRYITLISDRQEQIDSFEQWNTSISAQNKQTKKFSFQHRAISKLICNSESNAAIV